MTLQFGVIGSPIGHSLSPQIHQHFANQFKLELIYQKILSTPEDFDNDVRRFFESGGGGLNVTLPFKRQAFELAEQTTERARAAKSVNTLWTTPSGQLVGDTTDAIGLIRDWRRLGIDAVGQTVLVLGAGGATRAILAELVNMVESIWLFNRTQRNAENLLAELDLTKQVKMYNHQPLHPDMVINSTSEGATALLSATGVELKGTRVYDVSYAKRAQAFMAFCRAQGAASVHDGSGMLIEQAAESFTLWHGLNPETKELHATLFEH